MKTALTELIEWMEEQYYPAMYEDAIDKATELLEKEREDAEKVIELETLCAEAMGEMPKEWRDRFRKVLSSKKH